MKTLVMTFLVSTLCDGLPEEVSRVVVTRSMIEGDELKVIDIAERELNLLNEQYYNSVVILDKMESIGGLR